LSARVPACKEPECSVLITRQTLKLRVVRHGDCDRKVARLLDGALEITIAHAFDRDTKHRGMHGGEFNWRTKAGVVTGELAGDVAGTLEGNLVLPCRA
jgi:hypothetical protein